MTYRCGIGHGITGIETPPSVECDLCGFVYVARYPRGGGPPAWLRDNTAPRGWLRRLILDDARPGWSFTLHFCPRCRRRALDTPGTL